MKKQTTKQRATKKTPEPTPTAPMPQPEQLDLLSYLNQIEDIEQATAQEIATIEPTVWAELRAIVEPEVVATAAGSAPPTPSSGQLYTGRSVTGKEFMGCFGFITQSGLWALYESPETRKLVALIRPETAREYAGL